LSTSVRLSEESILKQSASILRKSVIETIEKPKSSSWPPTVDELEDKERTSEVKYLSQFLKYLLVGEDSHHLIADSKHRVIKSIADDIIYNISNGKFLTLKHCSLGLTMHSMTGQKHPIVLLSRLGHCISYEKVSEIETAQGEVAQQFQSNSSLLPIQPIEETTKVSCISKFMQKAFNVS